MKMKMDKIKEYILDVFDQVWIWVHNLIRPYNKLKIPTLDRTYTDPRERLVHAAFTVLVDFVENEMYGTTDWATMIDTEEKISTIENDEEREYRKVNREAHDKIINLYYWWKYERPHRDDTKQHVVTMLAYDTMDEPIREEGDHMYFDSSVPRSQFQNPVISSFKDEREYGWEDKEDVEKLKDLAEVQPYLWS